LVLGIPSDGGVSILVLMDFALKLCFPFIRFDFFYVSILVLMDFALKLQMQKNHASLRKLVSILVLMDFALKLLLSFKNRIRKSVSILVLMDFALKLENALEKREAIKVFQSLF